MNIAVIFSGGMGKRFGDSIPKQFLMFRGAPIIVHTLDVFQTHPLVDGIILVMLEDWISRVEQIINRHGIDKVKAVIPGGRSGQESIYKGLKKAGQLYAGDNLVLIHDGVRPLVSHGAITKNIEIAKKYGNAITTATVTETVINENRDGIVGNILKREDCLLARAPQTFVLKEILAAHEKAISDGNLDFIDSASLMMHYGHTLHTSPGNNENIKITTPVDFFLFKAYVEAMENGALYGGSHE